jgi:hypothetical protein
MNVVQKRVQHAEMFVYLIPSGIPDHYVHGDLNCSSAVFLILQVFYPAQRGTGIHGTVNPGNGSDRDEILAVISQGGYSAMVQRPD